MRVACGMVLLVAWMPAFAQSNLAVEWIESNDRLSNGSASWRGEELRLSSKLAPRHQIDAALRQISRFGLTDSQFEVNYAFPASKRLTGLVTASASPSHRFLPKTDLGGSLQYEFASAWLLTAGAGRTEYDSAAVNKAALGVEHYFSGFRAAASWKPTRSSGVQANGGDLRFDYYYGDVDSIGFQAATGREAANIDGRGVSVTSVRSTAVTGRHQLNGHWILRYAVEKVKQGDFYNRTGIRLGAQYTF